MLNSSVEVRTEVENQFRLEQISELRAGVKPAGLSARRNTLDSQSAVLTSTEGLRYGGRYVKGYWGMAT